MRHSEPINRETWAAYVSEVLATAKQRRTTVTAIAAHVQVDRSTLYKWAKGTQAPESLAYIRRFAEAAGDDLRIATRAAGVADADEPPPPVDEPAIAIIRQSSLPDYLKAEYLDELANQSAEDMERRRRWAEKLLKATGRTGLNKPDAPR